MTVPSREEEKATYPKSSPHQVVLVGAGGVRACSSGNRSRVDGHRRGRRECVEVTCVLEQDIRVRLVGEGSGSEAGGGGVEGASGVEESSRGEGGCCRCCDVRPWRGRVDLVGRTRERNVQVSSPVAESQGNKSAACCVSALEGRGRTCCRPRRCRPGQRRCWDSDGS